MINKLPIILAFIILMSGFAAGEHIAKQANFHLSFEGQDNVSLDSPCWANRGITGQYTTPFRPTTFPTTPPTVTENGISGQAFDSTALVPMTANIAYTYGSYSTAVVPVEHTLIDVNSVTVTAWIKVPGDATYTQGRLFSNSLLEVNYLMGNHGEADEYAKFSTRVNVSEYADGSSSSDQGYYIAKDKWVFVAITYDALTNNGQLKYYYGDEDNSVQLDTTLDIGAGPIGNGRHGGNIWFANEKNHGSGTKPFVGHIDEFRIYSAEIDSSGALDITDIESIREYDLSNRFADYSDVIARANVHFSFDGELRDEDVIGSPAWANSGITGTGERASRLGSQVSPLSRTNAIALYGVIPEVTANGIKNQAYDGTGFTPGTNSNTLNWGEFSFDTLIEEAIKDVWSFTITGWLKTNDYIGQGRILVTPPIGLNFIQRETRQQIIGSIAGSGYNVRSGISDKYDTVEKWVFFAMTYDGTRSENNVQFFVGSESSEVVPDASDTEDWGQLVSTGYGGNIYFGNVHPTKGRPFVGYIDEFRIWSTQEQSSEGALSYDEIEAVRKHDLGITKCDGDFLSGDVNRDCFVNIEDVMMMLEDWLECNGLGDPGCVN